MTSISGIPFCEVFLSFKNDLPILLIMSTSGRIFIGVEQIETYLLHKIEGSKCSRMNFVDLLRKGIRKSCLNRYVLVYLFNFQLIHIWGSTIGLFFHGWMLDCLFIFLLLKLKCRELGWAVLILRDVSVSKVIFTK